MFGIFFLSLYSCILRKFGFIVAKWIYIMLLFCGGGQLEDSLVFGTVFVMNLWTQKTRLEDL